MALPVTIISGFLGAGKTTLLSNLLAAAPERLAVLVNDFADINIDARLIERATPNMIALSNGCVCCTLRDDLVAAALDAARSGPDRIVIETSGVADPYGVMEAFHAPALAERLTVDSTVCLVDVEQYPLLDFASGELAISQAAVSDIVLLNKCDLVSETALQAVERDLLGALPAMRIVRTTGARIAWPILLGVARNGHAAAREHAHAHGPGFQAWSWQSAEPIALDAFRRIAAQLPRAILRGKGILDFTSGEHGVFQLVGKRSSLTLGARNGATSALVLIGPGDSFSTDALDDLFAALTTEFAA